MSTPQKPKFSETTQTASRNIRSVMAARRVTTRELSNLTGISISTISRITSDQRDITLSEFARICEALHVSQYDMADYSDKLLKRLEHHDGTKGATNS